MPNNRQATEKTSPDEDKLGAFADGIGICQRLFLIIVGITSVSLAIATTSGCDFLIFEPAPVPEGVEPTNNAALLNITRADVGLFRYDPDGMGCRKISDDFDAIGWALTTARIGNDLALILSLTGLLLVFIDLLCCRFPCSRLLISNLFLFSCVGQSLTFLFYAGDVCSPNFKKAPYPCFPAKATYLSISATVLFLVTSILSCCVAKPTPLLKRVFEHARNDENDDCCMLCRKKPKDEQEEKDEEVDTEMGVEKKSVVKTAAAIATNGPGNAADSEEAPKVERALETTNGLATAAGVTTALTAVRQGKQEEIIKQLEILTRYKAYLSEKEFAEKMKTLLHSLPDPKTFDKYTKTGILVDLEGENNLETDYGNAEQVGGGDDHNEKQYKEASERTATTALTPQLSEISARKSSIFEDEFDDAKQSSVFDEEFDELNEFHEAKQSPVAASGKAVAS